METVASQSGVPPPPPGPVQAEAPGLGLLVPLAAALSAAIAGAALAQSPVVVVATGGLVAATAMVVLATSRPRWALTIELFIIVTYAIGVLATHTAAPLIAEPWTFPAVIAGGLLYRRLLLIENVRLPTMEAALLAALGVTMALSLAVSNDPSRGVDRIIDFAESALVVILIITLLDDAVWLRRAAWAVAMGGGGLAALTVVQQLTRAYESDFGGFAEATLQPGDELFRSAGPLSPNYFGALLVFSFAIALYLFLSSRATLARTVVLVAAAVCFLGVGFTFSRGCLLAGVVVVGLASVLQIRRSRVPLAVLVLALVLGVTVLPATAKERVVESVSPVTVGASGSSDASIKGRVSENLAAAYMFLDHPVLGVGPGNYPLRYVDYSQGIGLDPRATERSPHSLYLEYLAETGFFGTLVFLAILWRAAARAWRARANLPENDALLAEGFFVGLVAYLVNGVFLHGSAYPTYVWLAIALALAAGRVGMRLRPATDERAVVLPQAT